MHNIHVTCKYGVEKQTHAISFLNKNSFKFFGIIAIILEHFYVSNHRYRSNPHPFTSGIAKRILKHWTWCFISRARESFKTIQQYLCNSTTQKRKGEDEWISSGKNQNILNAHIKFFRFITMDLLKSFSTSASCVKFERSQNRKRRE